MLAAVLVSSDPALLVGVVCCADEACKLREALRAEHLPQLGIGLAAFFSIASPIERSRGTLVRARPYAAGRPDPRRAPA